MSEKNPRDTFFAIAAKTNAPSGIFKELPFYGYICCLYMHLHIYMVISKSGVLDPGLSWIGQLCTYTILEILDSLGGVNQQRQEKGKAKKAKKSTSVA